MLLIANPIYDTAFKYLLDDKASAKTLISAILNLEIVDLELQSNEVPISFPHVLSPTDVTINVMRLDFKATIRLKNSDEILVLIEVQKAKALSDIGRFRRYLASQYSDSKNLRENPNNEIVGLPIISIYFLGYNLGKFMDSPVINVMRVYSDNFSQNIIQEKDQFIESISHDSVIVQVPLLKKFRRNKLEKLLSIFSSLDKTSQEFENKDFPDEYRHIIERLSQVMMDQVLKESLISEKEYVEQYLKKLADSEHKLAEAQKKAEEEKLLKEKAEAKATEEQKQKEEERRLKEEERRLKEEERRLKEEERRKKEEAQTMARLMVLKLQGMGLSFDDIAKELGKTVDEVKEIIK